MCRTFIFPKEMILVSQESDIFSNGLVGAELNMWVSAIPTKILQSKRQGPWFKEICGDVEK